jgi:peptide/nickel transport system ATP-binding protein
MSNEILKMQNVDLYLGKNKNQVQILSNFSLTIKRGEAAGLIGETGCGKTLTARSIIRLLPSTATLNGTILYNDSNIVEYDENSLLNLRRHEIAMIPQNPMTSLDPLFTIQQQMFETLEKKLTNSEKLRECKEVLSKVELEPSRVLRSYPYQLSGGMLQRVLIAMVLIRKPKLIIADEITTALDLTTQIKILSLIKKIREVERISMLIVTHDMKVVRSLCETISVMYVGRIVENGSTQDVLKNTRHPYTKALMGSIPVIGKTELDSIAGIVPSFNELPSGCKFGPRCQYVFKECRDLEPALIQVEASKVACHLYSEGQHNESP